MQLELMVVDSAVSLMLHRGPTRGERSWGMREWEVTEKDEEWDEVCTCAAVCVCMCV